MARIKCFRCGGSGLEQDWALIGAIHRDIRKEYGLTLRQMAKRMKISAPFLNDMESGRRHYTSKWKAVCTKICC